jgi:hypothetical protein
MLKAGLIIVKNLLKSPKFITLTLAVIAVIAIPLTLIEVQSKTNLEQNAEGIFWLANQTASTACAPDGSGANIAATFTNSESPSSSTAMNVTVTDQQTGLSVRMGSVTGGQTQTSIIKTGKTSLQAGQVTFALSWTDGHSGTDSRTASYTSVSKCASTPTPTPTLPAKPTNTPTPLPSGAPTPTICPTLAPVQNVKIICPNCQLKQ